MVNPQQDIADALQARMDELTDEWIQRAVYGDGTGEPIGILPAAKSSLGSEINIPLAPRTMINMQAKGRVIE